MFILPSSLKIQDCLKMHMGENNNDDDDGDNKLAKNDYFKFSNGGGKMCKI